jgi:hypothetical protein
MVEVCIFSKNSRANLKNLSARRVTSSILRTHTFQVPGNLGFSNALTMAVTYPNLNVCGSYLWGYISYNVSICSKTAQMEAYNTILETTGNGVQSHMI